MSEPKFLKFGPDVAYRSTRPSAYISITDARSRKQLGSDMIVGGEHTSLSEFEKEIEQLHRDLDEALRQAKEYFQKPGRRG